MLRPAITASFTVALLTGWTFYDARSKPETQTGPLVGAWSVVQVTRDSAGTRRTTRQPGLYLFTQRHYSITRVDSSRPRPDFPGQARRTAHTYEEIWGPFSANAGVYEIQGRRIWTRPQVAKNPSTMVADNFVVYEWRTKGDTLWMKTIANADGVVSPGTLVKLVRAERP
ncbi:MAG TPA: hypothetical protein VGC44_15400 [Longimicrobiales bacterium]